MGSGCESNNVSTVCNHNFLPHKMLMETMTSCPIGEETVVLPPIVKTLREKKKIQIIKAAMEIKVPETSLFLFFFYF